METNPPEYPLGIPAEVANIPLVPSSELKLSAPSRKGASTRAIYSERKVKYFAISESEIRAASSHNSHFTMWCSLMGGAIGAALGFVWDIATSDVKEPAAIVLLCFCAIAILVFLAFSITEYWKGKSFIDVIKDESRD
jgi:hypothetical protein